MDIQVIASGSKGNCYRVSDGKTNLLLECGLPFKRIQEGLNFRLSQIDGVLVSHEHMDHAKASLDMLMRGQDVYLSAGTALELGLDHHRLLTMRAGQERHIGTFTVHPFATQHDAVEPLGFYLYSSATKERLVYATDTYYLRYTFVALDYILIECNYCEDILDANVAAGLVPRALRDRLLESHFSLHNVKRFLEANDLSRVKAIWLIHMSELNCDAGRAKREIQELTGKPVYIAT